MTDGGSHILLVQSVQRRVAYSLLLILEQLGAPAREMRDVPVCRLAHSDVAESLLHRAQYAITESARNPKVETIGLHLEAALLRWLLERSLDAQERTAVVRHLSAFGMNPLNSQV